MSGARPGPASPRGGGPGVLGLSSLLLRARVRQLRGGLLRAPPAARVRVWGLAALLVPLSYLGLWSAAFAWLGRRAPHDVQAAALALVVGGLMLSGLLGKLASGDLLRGGGAREDSGLLAFYLSRPVSLARLLAARALTACALDPWGALFLLPVLAVAALQWRLGLTGIVAALAGSLSAQVLLTGLAQAGQVILLRALSPPALRAATTALALGAAGAVAALWLLASALLRQAEATVAALAPWTDALLTSPWLAPLAAPARVLAAMSGAAGAPRLANSLATLVALVPAAIVAAHLAGRWAARRGFQLGVDAALTDPGAPPARRAPPGRPPLSLAGREWLALRRDPPRLVTLLALPCLFLLVQWALLDGGPARGPVAAPAIDYPRAAVIAYSLCVYLAAFAPLGHMQAERATLWLLLATPRPIGRLLLDKARAWALALALAGAAGFLALALGEGWTRGAPLDPGEVVLGLVRVGAGAVALAFLAIGMGAAAAELARPERAALPAGTVYLFLLVAGLFNLVLLDPAGHLAALPLLCATGALHWLAGVARARRCLDPEPSAPDARLVAPEQAMLAALLWYLGARASRAAARAGATAAEITALELGWGLCFLVVLGLSALRARGRQGNGARGRDGPAVDPDAAASRVTARTLRGLALTLAAPAAGLLLAGVASGRPAAEPLAPDPPGAPRALALLLGALWLLARERVLRDLAQRAAEQLLARGAPAAPVGWTQRLLAAALALALAQLVAPAPGAWLPGLAQHAIAAALFATTGSSWPGWLLLCAAHLGALPP